MRANRITKIVVGGVMAVGLVSAALGACVDKVEPCFEFDGFAALYGGADCPAVDAWASACATNLEALEPEIRQDFDWCVDCYRLQGTDEPDLDCAAAPLGAACPTLLNSTLDASCF